MSTKTKSKKTSKKTAKKTNNGKVSFTAAETKVLVAASKVLLKTKGRSSKRVFASVARGLDAIVAYNA